jgi:hypothetical protein
MTNFDTSIERCHSTRFSLDSNNRSHSDLKQLIQYGGPPPIANVLSSYEATPIPCRAVGIGSFLLQVSVAGS